MSNYVKIATVGPRPPEVGLQTKPQDLTDYMITHWQQEFAQILPDKPDLIVVPEVCDRPADWPPDEFFRYYKVRGVQVREFFARTARENSCYMVYSASRQAEDGKWYNSSVILDRKGKTAGIYNKNHLVAANEASCGFLYGQEASLIECDFGRVGCAVCFDLNFDQLRLKYASVRPDLLIFSSVYHGGDLVQGYWAYSCRCHFVGAVAGFPSQIRNPFGQVLASSTNYRDYAVATVNLDCCLAHYDGNWDKFKALKAEYGPQVDIHDPAYVGSVLISSLTQNKSAVQMAKEFEVELLDDYFARSLKHRNSAITS